MSSEEDNVTSRESFPPPPPPLTDGESGERDGEYTHYTHKENNNNPSDPDAVTPVMDDQGHNDDNAMEMQDLKTSNAFSDSVSVQDGSALSEAIDHDDTATQITTLTMTSRESKDLRVRFKDDPEDEVIGFTGHQGTSDNDTKPNPISVGTSRSKSNDTALSKVRRALICYSPDSEEERIYLKSSDRRRGDAEGKRNSGEGNYLSALGDLTTAVDLQDEERSKRRETLFFLPSKDENDSERYRIDYVLAYNDDGDEAKQAKRKIFEDNLRAEGILLQIDTKENSVDLKTAYVKIHAPMTVLFHNADLMNMRKRIKKEKTSAGEDSCECCCSCQSLYPDENVIPDEDDVFFTAPFNKSRKEMFEIDPDDESSFFTSSERSLIVKEVLDRTAYTRVDANEKKFGISALRNQGVYTAAFPLHEGASKPEADEVDPFDKSRSDRDRMRLYEVWARPKNWYKYQPLDFIRKYFGEKIAIYFTWLGFYTMMLIPASAVGLVAFIYGLATLFDNRPSEDICDDSGVGSTLMCPQCDQDCPFWHLNKSCFYSRVSYVFDNYATVAFSCFMAIWATIFLEFWKREQNTLQYDWDVSDFELVERMRPEFEFKMKKTKANPITHIQEPYMPWYSKIPRILTSTTVIVVMIVLVVAAIIGVIVYRIVIVTVFYLVNEPDWVGANASLLTTITAATINFIIIMLLNVLYKRIALALTDLETHRTYTDYEDSYTYKMFLFQFVNFYGTIFYIAFFKGRFIDYPGSQKYIFFNGYKQDTCDPAGCLIELTIQLFIVMVGKQALNNFKEVLLPGIKNWFRGKGKKAKETEDNLYMRWEQDNNLEPLDNLALFEEYLEMVIQYGFVTIFVAAFPLAPFFALINNIIEIRLDAYKFLSQFQRLPALRAQDIGAWYSILQSLSFVAVLSNAAIIAWTSEFIPKLVYLNLDISNGTLDGYVSNSLASFRVGDYPADLRPPSTINSTEYNDSTICGYRAYRYGPDDDDKYTYTTQHWQVLCARLAFMLVFEHVCFLATWFVSFLIPDVPSRIRTLMVYEKQLVRQMTFDASNRERQQERLEPYQTT